MSLHIFPGFYLITTWLVLSITAIVNAGRKGQTSRHLKIAFKSSRYLISTLAVGLRAFTASRTNRINFLMHLLAKCLIEVRTNFANNNLSAWTRKASVSAVMVKRRERVVVNSYSHLDFITHNFVYDYNRCKLSKLIV